MQYLQEVTVWNAGYNVPNHVYYVSDNKQKVVGYIAEGSKKLFKFKKPMSFDVRGRKFVKVDRKAEPDSVYFPKTEEEKPIANAIEVQGSNGKVYYVTKIANRYTCTCPGFMFRRKCRHVEEMSV